MTRTNNRYRILNLFCCLVLAALAPSLAPGEECGSTTKGSPEGPPLQPEDVCSIQIPQIGPDSNPAVQNADEFAWRLFSEVNQPADDGTNDTLWQTWANQADVYVAKPNPQDPPHWNEITAAPRPKKLAPSIQRSVGAGKASAAVSASRNPCDPGNLEEVRMNRATFNYIIDNGLWYIEGQIDAFNDDLTVSFPTTSKEVKANWVKIDQDQTSQYHSWRGSGGQYWGLASMHLISKDLPNWTWATFENVNNPCYGKHLKPQDNFGLSANGKANPALQSLFVEYGLDVSLWSHYRLDGAQTTFTDTEGRPIILGNSITELGFQTTASCMTCHARSSIDAKGKRLSVFNNDNTYRGQPQSYNGAPDPNWYTGFSASPPERKFLQLDFVWSLLCANSENSTTQKCSAPPVDTN